MTVRVKIITEGRSYNVTKDGATLTVPYHVLGAADEIDAMQQPSIPVYGSQYLNYALWATTITVEPVQGKDDFHEVILTYSSGERGTGESLRPNDPENGDEYWTFSGDGQNVLTRQALAQVKYGQKAREVANLVGVQADGSVEGVSALTFYGVLTVTLWKNTSDVNASYLRGLAKAYGRYNNNTWYGFEAGEALFAYYNIPNRGTELTELEFRFHIQPNATGAELPTFTGMGPGETITITGGKKGHQYMWLYQDEKDNHGDKQMAVRGAYIADVYKDSSFSALGLSGDL